MADTFVPHPTKPFLYARFADTVRQFYVCKSAKLSESIDGVSVKKTHWSLLHYLADHDGSVQQDIADAAGITRSTVSELISEMERDGLLYRIPCQENRRKVQIFLTEKGSVLSGQIQKLYIEYLEECLRGFSQEEIKLLEDLMERFG